MKVIHDASKNEKVIHMESQNSQKKKTVRQCILELSKKWQAIHKNRDKMENDGEYPRNGGENRRRNS